LFDANARTGDSCRGKNGERLTSRAARDLQQYQPGRRRLQQLLLRRTYGRNSAVHRITWDAGIEGRRYWPAGRKRKSGRTAGRVVNVITTQERTTCTSACSTTHWLEALTSALRWKPLQDFKSNQCGGEQWRADQEMDKLFFFASWGEGIMST